jgi:hypothetical protein
VNSKGFTLRLENRLFSFPMPDALANQITNGDVARLRKPIDVLTMEVVEDGFVFVLANEEGKPENEVKYQPEHFGEYLQEIAKAGIPTETILSLGTTGAAGMLQTFFSWLNHKLAAEFERDIRSGKLTFDEARKIRKEVFDVPSFGRFFAQSFKNGDMPKGKRGKRTKYRREVEELYALACRTYRETAGLSWEAACFSATEQRPDLVPSSWCTDPDGNLRREAARYWDKSMYSQLSYRQSRDR